MSRRKTVQDIEEMATEYNYVGQVEESNYIGQDQEFDFGGARSFAGESRTGRDFGFKIKNDHTEDVKIVLNPAFFADTAELINYGFTDVDGILTDGDIATIATNKITATALNASKKIVSLLRFTKANPTRIVRVVMTSTTSAQFEKDIRIENVAPFNKLGDSDIQLTDHFSPSQLNTTKIDIDLLESGKILDFNDQNVIILTVAANSTCTINLKVGAISNPSARLADKASRAYANMHSRRRH